MHTRAQEVGLFCFVVGILLIWAGFQIWKRKKTEWIPAYKKKNGENTAAYCAMVGKGVILSGVGMFILSIPISLAEPNKFFALSCLICSFIFIGMGFRLYFRAEKLYRP